MPMVSTQHPARPAPPSSGGRRSVLPLVVGGLSAVLVGAAGAAGISWANAEVYSPAAPVEQYLQALQDGDGSTAAVLSQAALEEGSGTALLDGEPLAATVGALEDLRVHDAGHSAAASAGPGENGPAGEGSGTTRQIEVTGSADGTPFRTVFTVSRQGTQWLFFDRWAMDPVDLPTVTVQPEGLATDQPTGGTVNGTDLALTNAEGQVVAPRLAVFPPGRVAVAYGSSNLTAAPDALLVGRAGQDQRLPLQVRPTDEAVQRLQQQVEQYLGECTEQQVLHPTGCPLDHQSTQRVDPSSIRWEMVQMPQLDPAASAASSSAGASPAEVTLEGTARISLTQRDLMTGEQQEVSQEVPVSFTGTVQVTPESVRFTPQVG